MGSGSRLVWSEKGKGVEMPVIAATCEKAINNLKALPMSATLFSNDHTPTIDDADDASEYTTPTGTGLDPIIMSSWEGVVLTEGRADDEYELSWTPSGALTGYVYGVFVRDYMGGDLIGAVRFPAPILLEDGVPINYILKLWAKDPAAA